MPHLFDIYHYPFKKLMQKSYLSIGNNYFFNLNFYTKFVTKIYPNVMFMPEHFFTHIALQQKPIYIQILGLLVLALKIMLVQF